MNSGEEEPKTPRRVREWTGFTRRCPMPLLTTEQVRLQLTNGGFVAAEEEAIELVAAADGVAATLDDLLQRRLSGEPLAWITGTTTFMGHTIAITPGVYVPRWQSESLARRAVELCPPHGRALDLCTGSGAIAAVLAIIVLPAHDHAATTAAAAQKRTGRAVNPVPKPVPRPDVEVAAGQDGADPVVPASPWRQLDWIGSISLSASVTLGLLALNVAPSWGFTAPKTLGLFALSLMLGAAFIFHERRTPSPLIPLHYFKKRNFVLPLGARAFVNFAYMGGFFLFPILMEGVYGYSETSAGLLSTARPLMFSLSAPIAGYAAVKVGERWSIVAGAAALTVSMLVFTQVGANPSVVLIIVALGLSGLGNGVSTPSTAASAANEVAPEELGVMSAAQLLITQIGIVAGIQVMVTVQASSLGGAGSLASFHRAYLVGALVALAACVCGYFVKDTPRGKQAAPAEVALH